MPDMYGFLIICIAMWWSVIVSLFVLDGYINLFRECSVGWNICIP
jgi:hypothetical protein